MADKPTVPYVADSDPRYVFPGEGRPWDRDDVLDLVQQLDFERAFGERELNVWESAANYGKWTVEEAHAAVLWVNVNVTGFVKAAHVHQRIERERELLRKARMLAHEHPAAAAALGYPSVAACIDDYNRDILGWRESDKADHAFAVFTRAEWIEWAERVR
jgi:hypothetical protein